MKVLSHIGEQDGLSLGSHARPLMAMEMKGGIMRSVTGAKPLQVQFFLMRMGYVGLSLFGRREKLLRMPKQY